MESWLGGGELGGMLLGNGRGQTSTQRGQGHVRLCDQLPALLLGILIKKTGRQVKRRDLGIGLGLGGGNGALQHVQGALGKIHGWTDAAELMRCSGGGGGKEDEGGEEEEWEGREAWGLGRGVA